MSKKQKTFRPKARLPKGFPDTRGAGVLAERAMLDTIAGVYARYGFEPLDTPAIEYTDALGKFLPDQDRPNAGVFSFQDEDDQWLSLRYDLTAPLARFVAENYEALPKPFRRYQWGPVWRNEKPGPGRFRQFTQIDADTVGTASMAADAELIMMVAECMEALDIPRGSYQVRVNNRKVLDGVLEGIGLKADDPNFETAHLTILRAIDKLDRLGTEGVELLLGEGRKDESGDYTKGAGLAADQVARILAFTEASAVNRAEVCDGFRGTVGDSAVGQEGIDELLQIDALLTAAGCGGDQVVFDPGIVRGLDYYTGPVFETELTFDALSEDGDPLRFGSVGSGGRYDDLVKRFKGVEVPATGISIGVSRLQAALAQLGKLDPAQAVGPVVVLVMDRERLTNYQAMVQELRNAGIRAELYLGTSGMRAQLKYADRRAASVAVIEGDDERAAGEVTLKDLALGAEAAKNITDNAEWRSGEAAQSTVKRADMVDGIKSILDRRVGR